MTETAINITKVSFKYRNGITFAIQEVTMEILKGEFILLAGYSGSGKSTLLRCINGLIPHFYSGRFGGKVNVMGTNTLETSTPHLAEKVGFVFQNPENQISNMTVEREIAFPLENFGIPKEKIITRVEEIIDLLDLERIRFKSPVEISGGEQQLTSIGAALALDPPILVLDEVTAHLSPKSAYKILDLLYELNKKHDKTILLTEHRLDRCINYVDKLAFLKEGRLLGFGHPSEIFYEENFPQEMLPKIPSIYMKLHKEFCVSKENFPLTVEDLTKIIGGSER
ncbi:MAG: ABC transporter ATP-binding protein [Candidatus Heimdallarchaeota archaeon]|nr:ABC transporter ATP-binding protein [Candidatus Heimdallarchaeota archaeon]